MLYTVHMASVIAFCNFLFIGIIIFWIKRFFNLQQYTLNEFHAKLWMQEEYKHISQNKTIVDSLCNHH